MTKSRKSKLRRTLTNLLPDDLERLTFNPVVRAVLNTVDQPARLLHPELRDLPPNHLRCRVGPGRKRLPWSNGPAFIQRGYEFWLFFFSRGMASLDSDVLEIGCGCGRNALVLKHLEMLKQRYTGNFLGMDIDGEAIAWCSRNIQDKQFAFDVSAHGSAFYKKAENEGTGAEIPLEDDTRDFVFASAVFGHLLQAELQNYLAEAARVLRPGGTLFFTFRCLEWLPDNFREQFEPTDTDAFVIDKTRPEKNVAYRHASMVAMVERHGFHDIQIFPRDNIVQALTAKA